MIELSASGARRVSNPMPLNAEFLPLSTPLDPAEDPAPDPYGVGAIVDALYEVGISGQDTIVGINQSWKLSGAIKTAERKAG